MACEGTEILELLVTHGATFIKLTCSIPGRFPGILGLRMAVKGFLNCAMSLVLRRPNDINYCVLGLHEKVWNEILKAFCNCKG